MNPSAIDLVVTDLDGTLWDRDECIHDRTLEALRRLEAEQVPVLVATGRRLRSARRRLHADGLFLPIVALDGAVGYDDQRRFQHRTFTSGDAREVLALLADVGVSPCLYVDDREVDVVIGQEPSTHPEHQLMLAGVSRRAELSAAADRYGVYAMGMYGVNGGRAGDLARLAEGLQATFAVQGGDDPYFGGYSLIVYAPGTSKWAGVQAFCAYAGLDDSRVLAVGDGPNDLELLAGARIACVVEDGCDPALALADEVIDPASAGGWARVLDLLPPT